MEKLFPLRGSRGHLAYNNPLAIRMGCRRLRVLFTPRAVKSSQGPVQFVIGC
jgi:hypothetical protein